MRPKGVICLVLELLMLASSASAGGEWLNNGVETEETFVEYPPEIQTLAAKEIQLYTGTFNGTTNTGASFPVVRAFTRFPETVHNKMMKVYDYMELFHRKHCLREKNISLCSLETMQDVGAHHSSLKECLQEDKVDEDVASKVLDRHLQHLKGKKLEDFPLVEVNGQAFSVDEQWPFNSHSLLAHFCDAFDDPPLACQHCLACEDSRTCLWKLACDGTPLFQDGTSALASTPTLEPNKTAMITVKPTGASTAAVLKDNQTVSAADMNRGTGLDGLGIFTISIVLLAVTCPVLLLTYRHLRTKQLMDEILASLSSEDNKLEDVFMDKTSDCEYEAKSTNHLGESCRRKKPDMCAVAIGQAIDCIEGYIGPTSPTMRDTFEDEDELVEIVEEELMSVEEDDILVEDLLDDESASALDYGQGSLHRAESNLGGYDNEKPSTDGPQAESVQAAGGSHQTKSNGVMHPYRRESKRSMELQQRVTAQQEGFPAQFRKDREDVIWTELMC
ncbi:expressed unknown protein [Seminavis robusta]|uniref:Uncharacterized protein n=1 Tax=Seminavis robusta TaxID=568900 RepID=A0A9N8HXW5_9STRA|nr:expressed unknown protein [Seminavis robusta]|eukprot:Sro2329_g323540.1 n/a (503) ;mRNA; r:10460-12511